VAKLLEPPEQEMVHEIGARSLEAEAGFEGGEPDVALEEGEENRGGL
jgi:hypothetical protein